MWREIIGLLNTGATTGATVAPCKTSQKRYSIAHRYHQIDKLLLQAKVKFQKC